MRISDWSSDVCSSDLAYLAGDFQMMVNNGILTTGFDFPGLDYISMMKATRRSSLWVQMLGRGTRPLYFPEFDLSDREGRLAAIAASQKQNCLVGDFAKNTESLGTIHDTVHSSEEHQTE